MQVRTAFEIGDVLSDQGRRRGERDLGDGEEGEYRGELEHDNRGIEERGVGR